GGSRLRFAPRHRPLRLRLPGGRVLRLHLNFAKTPGRAAARVCCLLGIRHPEELSLLRPEEEERREGRGRKGHAPDRAPPDLDLTHLRPRAGERRRGNGGRPGGLDPPPYEAPPPALPPDQLRALVTPGEGRDPPALPRSPRGNPFVRRAQLHARWLDTSRSLMEQDVVDDEELLLRFKYPCAMGMDPQEGGLRIALLYEQARRALLAEEIDCTEEEMLLFAALQYQTDGAEGGDGNPEGPLEPQDLDTALDKLELSLGGQGTAILPVWGSPQEELGAAPELVEELEIYRSSRWPFWGSRPARAVLSKSSLSLWSLPGSGGAPQQLNLCGCEVTPDVDLRVQKFCIKLRVPMPEGMSETLLRCRDAFQYARWVAGCRLASRGGSLSATSLGAEARGVLEVLGV
ncbi:URP2 protein, partial [Neopipo cinnamomea]|nr:URP2 protein [Neopipo cinnamomea]